MTALLSPEQAAERLHVSERTLRDLRKRGLIRYVAVTSRILLFRPVDLDIYLDSVSFTPKLPREVPVRVQVPTWPSVYFLRSGKTGPIKIGTAKCLANRLHALRTGHPENLYLLAAIRGGKVEEAALHQQFAADRLRGEWFAPSDALLAYLEQIGHGDQ